MAYNAYLVDEAATIRIAGRLSLMLKGEGLLFLDGQLGAGKTTFCRGILRAMGYDGSVKSPTFTIVEPYELNGGQVYHFDLYRLNDPEELEYLGMDDYLEGNNLCLIEWAERGDHFLPECDLRINLTVKGQGRILRVTGNSARGRDICRELAEADGGESNIPL